MQFKPEKQIVFSYIPDKHLSCNVIMTNNSPVNQLFKFKTSTPTRITVKPSNGYIKPNHTIEVKVFLHRQIIDKIQNQCVQIQYGQQQYNHTHNFTILLQNGSKRDSLNLTMMVTQKQQRVKRLQNELQSLKQIKDTVKPSTNSKKKKTITIPLAISIVAGLLFGFFVPFQVY